jgi:hypothetical protein
LDTRKKVLIGAGGALAVGVALLATNPALRKKLFGALNVTVTDSATGKALQATLVLSYQNLTLATNSSGLASFLTVLYGNWTILAEATGYASKSVPASVKSPTQSIAIALTASTSTNADYNFFIAPNIDMITAIVKNIILGPFNDSAQRAGYNYSANLPQGGFIPAGQQAGRSGAWTNGLILDDNGMQMSLGVDYWSGKLGLQQTACYQSCRKWFASTFTLSNGTGPATYNPAVAPSRREIYLGNASPVYRKIVNVTGTTSQTYWATSNTPDGANHGPNTTLPCVTALPQGTAYNSPSNMEGYGGRIILDWLANPAKAATEFAAVMASVHVNSNGTGDVSGVYGGGATRSVVFTLFAARVTGYWQSYQSQCQALLNTLRAIKGPNGGLPQTWSTTNPAYTGQNEFTPEPNGQYVMLTNPNVPLLFT